MHVQYDFAHPQLEGPCVAALSAFDGVTREHLRLLAHAQSAAQARGARVVVLLSWRALADEQKLSQTLTTLDERLLLLDQSGLVEQVVILTTNSLDRMQQFASHIVVAEDERASVLSGEAGEAVEPVVEVVSDVPVAFQTQLLAQAIAASKIADATQALGHPYILCGTVQPGDRRGRLLGFPTANLAPNGTKVLPRNGVYAVRVRLPGEDAASHVGVTNIGVRPTFGTSLRQLVEVHLLDAQIDLYGLPLVVEFVAHLRDEQRFDGIDALKAQIAHDVQLTRDLTQTPATFAHDAK